MVPYLRAGRPDGARGLPSRARPWLRLPSCASIIVSSCPPSANQQFIPAELNELVRDLGLSNDAAQILESQLKDKNLLPPRTTISRYRCREMFTEYFFQEGSLAYCNNITEVVMKPGADNYDSTS
ncbi:hypothetical protein EVAR_97408_1 [Eumeta japonica]|uniref:Uncharacterized protein n=1 Tax=Eumeta variegata TaxID=151549 RepID=A0A4C1X0Z3_EUMVA|nr:hypothetical protein EVAR_97408_1 [Eumeta japonica]